MKCHGKRPMALFLALALVVSLCLGCGTNGDDERVTITIGYMTDYTGSAASAVASINYGVLDATRYYSEEGLVSGARLKLESWDARMDTSKTIPGYEWLRDRGAELILSLITQDGVLLKPVADRDKFPIFSMTTNEQITEPPGWEFCFSNRADQVMATLLKWVSEKHWDYGKGVPKIGFVGWNDPSAVEVEKGMSGYCQAHPGEFDYVHGYLPPVGTVMYSAEVEGLKDCDYVCAYAISGADFIKQYTAKGYETTYLDPATDMSIAGYVLARAGWEAVDGMLTAASSLTWSEPYPVVDFARLLLDTYRPGEADAIVDEGTGYVSGGVVPMVFMLSILQKAVEQVGAENLNSQAIYDAAVEYRVSGTTLEGFPQWGFSQTKRYLYDDLQVFEWDAAGKEFVMVQDWIPLVTEW